MDEAETSAEAAVVRAAISNRYLSAEQLREALLLREEFARLGHRVGLLQLLRQRHLPPRVLPELSEVYTQVLAGLNAQPTTYDPVPSGLAPQAIARARLLLQGHPAQDPPRVKVFVNRVGLALGYADSDSGRLSQASEGSGSLVAKRPDSGRLIPDSGRLSRDTGHLAPGSGRLVPDSGRLIPHTAEVPAHGGFVRQDVDSDSARLIPHTAEVPAQPAPPDVDQNAATVAAGALQRFGRYLVESELARGGMGVVYKAKDPHLERYVALKVMQGDGFDLDPTDVERFVREAKATAKMRHPYIVSVLDTGTAHGYPYLVMDLVQGESLGQRIKRSGPLDAPEAARLAAAVAHALEYSHQQGFLHRDVKPSNILLEASRGVPMLTDFGLARSSKEDGNPQLTGTGQAVGTPSYMAPEQATGETELLGPHTDVYGLGATLYHMLAGHPPFRGGTISVMHAVVAEAPKPLRELRENVPEELDAICMRCLAKDPTSRFATAGELASALEAVGFSVERESKPKPTAQRRTRPAGGKPKRPRPAPAAATAGSRRGGFILLGVSLGVMVVLAGYYFSRPPASADPEPRDPLVVVDPPPVDPPDPPAPPQGSPSEQARAYLEQLAANPSDGPDWQRTYRLTPWGQGGKLPWQITDGLRVAPSLPVRDVVVAVLLGQQDRFERAGELLGDSSEALQLCAELRAQARLFEPALGILRRLESTQAVREQRVRILCELREFDRARLEAQELPADSPLLGQLEDEAALSALGDEERLVVIGSLLAGTSSEARRYRLLVERATTLINLRRYSEAEPELLEAETLRPEWGIAPYYRYLWLVAEKQHSEAVRALEKAIELERDPEQALSLRWVRVQLLHLAGESRRAREELQRLRSEPTPPAAALSAAANASHMLGETDLARDLAEKGWRNSGIAENERVSCLVILLGVYRAKKSWKALQGLVEEVSGAGIRVTDELAAVLDQAHEDATQGLEGQ